MSMPLKELKADFSKSLLSSYANIAIMEVRMNNNSTLPRPSYKEILYMYCIYCIDDCTASDLVELFNTSKALVSQTVISMERKGFVTRIKDPQDNRRQILRVSDETMMTYSDEMTVIDESLKRMDEMYSVEDIVKSAKIVKEVTDCMLRVSTEMHTRKKQHFIRM
ncbi:MAG: MarR family transcriptional regulator [Candidatus Methanomethylophilaceae archaeon]|nr:MarR family transcriptional regulator [Candidatus Methanomethylophilaceae archaeon]